MEIQRNSVRLVGLASWMLFTVVSCTRVRQQTDPLPARPLPSPVRNEPVNRPPPVAYRPAPPPPDAAPIALPNTLNGDPNGLKREDINDALQAMLPSLAGCFPGAGPPTVGLSFDAEGNGRASNIKVSGVNAEAEQCVSGVLARAKLPVFQGKSVPVQFPISLYRPQAPAAEAPPPPANAPAPAPVVGAAPVAAPPAPGTSTAPYVPGSTIQPTAGSAPGNEVKTFIQP